MGVFLIVLLLLNTFSSVVAQNNSTFDPLQYVNQLIGTGASDNPGNVFAGASLPYGMAKASPDVNGQNTGGFALDSSNVTGFSHMHDSGTGGNPSQGQFPLFPQICPDDIVDNCNFRIEDRSVPYQNGSVVASPGYFELALASGIQAEMTVTQRTALYNFKFPTASSGNGSAGSPFMLLDLTDLWASRQNATVSVEGSRIKGNGTFLPSFGSGYYLVYFCADFFGASVKDNGIWVNSRAGSEPKEIFITRGINLFYLEGGAWIQFDAPTNGTITARVGVSFVSTDQACQNAETEIPDPPGSFNTIKQTAADAWREKLSTISVTSGGADDDMLTSFYTAIYRTMMSPQNYTGENPLWQSSIPYFDSFYCLWDSFRSQFPFLAIIDPSTVTQMMNSLLDTYKHVGWLPDCRMTLCKGFTQGGSNADNVFGDLWVKNATTGIDWQTAYAAVTNDAEHEPIDWSNEGRGGIQSWTTLNYVPYLDFDYLGFGTNSRSISRTVEYAYNDFCISELGKGLRKTDYQTYLARSNNWRNIFKADQTSFINDTDTGFVGFFQPKFLNGTWGFQDPITCSPITSFCSLTTNPQETFEDSIWEYQFFVPHDQASLISLLGGPQRYIDRLDYLHESGLQDIANEPSFLNCYLYHYAGRPGLSAARIHSYIPSQFNSTLVGLPGNDDSGAMGSFIAFALSGLFPVAGQDIYLITPPFFASVSFTSPLTGKTATITNKNFDPTYTDIYIQSATLDGQAYNRSWIGHSFFLNGGLLELVLGGEESAWGTGQGEGEGELPPSTGLGVQ